ncbi:MAG: phosphoribosylaminoimidazolesuccinocarboxamide synthase [Chromatiales bacterium]|nr:phosphoribosylaminoimidazolesuccinocarboxamide synthase [Gammaproteobacteria bacterium]MCP5351779.1 phosphoribosylaminoimidazolesuccinocarboxamide synthase [Chromatiales bacterium]
MTDTAPLFESSIKSLPMIHRGKVRDIYAIDDQHMLIVTTDRLSAFDVVMPTPIPGKGAVLTAVSAFWFRQLRPIIDNQMSSMTLEQALPDPAERAEVEGRAIVVRRLKALPIEAIVRGYLVGSGWKDYQATGKVCGIPLPAGMAQAGKLDQPLFTPSSKAAVGEHDENIDFEQVAALIGRDLAEQVRDVSIRLYSAARDHAAARGIIIADTKFEFGTDENGKLVLIDEVLTPDSSRFWPADQYRTGTNPPSFDKQFVRDYLETLDWNKQPPGPTIPADIVASTAAKYREAQARLTGSRL